MIPFASWSVLGADFLILLHLTICGVTLSALLHLAGAKWRYRVRDIAVSLFALYPLVFVLLVVLVVVGPLMHQGLFPWMQEGAEPGHHLNAWNNPVFLAARELGGLLIVGWLYRRYMRLQAASERSEQDWARFKMTANFIPVAHVIYGTMVAWDFEMTLIPFWESSVYGMYHFVSNFGMFLGTLAAMCYILNRSGRVAEPVPEYVFNYIAQMMLAFTILWTYLFFAQYLTIWYGNLPEERNRIENMVVGDYSVLWWSFFTMKFIIPFVLLIFTYFRHSPVSIFRIGLVVFAGTWIERFTWIAGSVSTGSFVHAPYPFSNPVDIVATAIIVAIAFLLVRRALGQSGVIGAAGSARAAAPAS